MAKLEEIHYDYLKKEEFKDLYLDILKNRLVYSNNKIEEDSLPIGKLYDNAHVYSLSDNLKALKILLVKLNHFYKLKDDFLKEPTISQKKKIAHEILVNRELTQDLIIEIANTINKHSNYISNGYRKNDNNVKFDDKYPIEKANNIELKMKELLDNYYGDWLKLDVFEREARSNIEFLRIHPFEDGNGRTSRLILNYNLLIYGHAPVLIPDNVREEYFDARNRQDVKWIKELFESESKKELEVLNILIDQFKQENEMGLK